MANQLARAHVGNKSLLTDWSIPRTSALYLASRRLITAWVTVRAICMRKDDAHSLLQPMRHHAACADASQLVRSASSHPARRHQLVITVQPTLSATLLVDFFMAALMLSYAPMPCTGKKESAEW